MLFNLFHITLIFVSFGLYGAYLLWDDSSVPEDTPQDKRIEFIWHAMGAFTFAVIAYTFYRFLGWRYVPFVLATAWLWFAGFVHTIGLKMPFFYVGASAITDRMQQWFARVIRVNVQTLSAVLKIGVYAVTVYYAVNGY